MNLLPCPYLPVPAREYTAADITVLGAERGAAFHTTCLLYAQSLWMAGFPAKSLLLLNRALSVPPETASAPPPYRAIAWMLANRPVGGFIGNPRRHWQHYATRMNEPQRELRVWRAWACWQLARLLLPEAEFPADHVQIRAEGIVEPVRSEIEAHLPAADLAEWLPLLPAAPAPPVTRIRRILWEELSIIQTLAHEIWHACYPGIIPVAQIDYMLGHWYDTRVMAAEMAERGVWFALMEVQEQGPVGYLSFEQVGGEPVLFINKLYLRPTMHGRGLGAAALDWAAQRAVEQGCTHLRLRVNKHNATAIRAYLRVGFSFAGDVVTDIGGGFVMDDYVMEKRIA